MFPKKPEKDCGPGCSNVPKGKRVEGFVEKQKLTKGGQANLSRHVQGRGNYQHVLTEAERPTGIYQGGG